MNRKYVMENMKRKLRLIIVVFVVVFVMIQLLVNMYGKEEGYGAIVGGEGKVYYLTIIDDFGAVSPSYSNYVKKNLELASKDKNAKAFIIEIDTPGGTLSDAQKIATYIKGMRIPTIAYVNDSAYSAGAIISLASDYVIISEGGKLGDAYPIVMDQSTGQASSIKDKRVYAKLMSGLRALMKASANKRINRIIKDISEGSTKYHHIRQKNVLRNLPRIFTSMVDPDVELTLENDGYSLKKGEILTLTSKEAYEIGVSDGIYNSLEEILKEFELDKYKLEVLEATTEDRLLSILTHPVLTSLLLSVGMLGLIMELWTAGFGIPGTIGLLALSLFFYGNLVVGNASYQSLILFLIALVLLSVEIFVTPGFGILGFAGVIALISSFVTALGVDLFDISSSMTKLSEASMVLIISFVVVVIGIIILYKYIPRSVRFSRITLKEAKIEGQSHGDNKELLGKRGVTLTKLRPSGIIMVDKKRYDAVAEGNYIEQGVSVKVIETTLGAIVVNPYKG